MLKKFSKPERAWIMYDWANSARNLPKWIFLKVCSTMK